MSLYQYLLLLLTWIALCAHAFTAVKSWSRGDRSLSSRSSSISFRDRIDKYHELEGICQNWIPMRDFEPLNALGMNSRRSFSLFTARYDDVSGKSSSLKRVGVEGFSKAKQNAIAKNYIRQIVRPDWKRITVSTVACIIGTLAAVSSPLAFGNVITVVLEPVICRRSLMKAVALIGASYAIEAVATFVYVWQMSITIENVLMRLKREIFKSILGQEIAYFDKRPVGEITNVVTSDISVLKSTLRGNLQRDRGIRAFLEVMAGFIIILRLCPHLATIFIAIIPVASTLVAESGKKLAGLEAKELESIGKESALISEVVRSIRTVRSFGTENEEAERHRALTDQTAQLARATGRNRGRQESISRAAIYLSILSVFWFGGQQISKGKLAPSLLLSFIGYCFNLNFGIQGLNFSYSDFIRASESMRRIFAVTLNADYAESEASEGVQSIPKSEFQGNVEFRKVGFSYPTRPNSKVLNELNLNLEANTVTALVGPSGAGKSTIAALLSRFYTPTQGDILIDGMGVRDLDRKWLTQQIAMVGQSPSLMSGSIADNIAYGLRGEKSMEDIVEAAKLANAHEFVEKFTEKYDTYVGDGGVRLSVGQRQRIAIARALLKGSKILILDEATSALDAGSEALVQEALTRLMKGRTVLVIAHRLSTVVSADKICVINAGKVVEEGKHDELMQKDGIYRKLMKTQVSSYSYLPL